MVRQSELYPPAGPGPVLGTYGYGDTDLKILHGIAMRDWNSHSIGVASWTAVCGRSTYLFAVAASGASRVAFSWSGGATWDLQTGATASVQWRAVCTGPSSYTYVVGQSAGIQHIYRASSSVSSTGQLTWALVGPTDSDNWTTIAYSPSLTLLVALTSTPHVSDQVLCSSNGTTWTRTGGTLDSAWSSICWSPELGMFCAVSTSTTTPGHEFMFSSNPSLGVWASGGGLAGTWNSVCWSPELGIFCAVGGPPVVGSTPRIMTGAYSPISGFQWTYRQDPQQAGVSMKWTSVCWSPQLRMFCAVGWPVSGGTNLRVMTSPDGINWTLRFAPGISWASVAWSYGQFCAVGVNNSMATAF